MTGKVMITLKEPYYYTEDGTIHFMAELSGWSELVILEPDACEHEVTSCTECKGDWFTDYWAKVVLEDGCELGLNGVPGMPDLNDAQAT